MIQPDEFGPEHVLQVYDYATGLHGILVIDNTARGPGKGGIRMQPDITVNEISRLARAMTWKTALAELPFGGAKAGILADPKRLDAGKKQALVRAFARKIKPYLPELYITAPDMSTSSMEMGWIVDETKEPKGATGKPAELGGIPHELGSTGFGVAEATIIATGRLGLKNFSVAIEGFGDVGSATARFLSERGARIVAVSDSRGAILDWNGFDIEKLLMTKKEHGTVSSHGGKRISHAELFSLDADVLIPGARPDVITAHNVDSIKAKIIVEAANIPMNIHMEKKLAERNILVIPDFLANSGGVISSYVEHIGGSTEEMFREVRQRVGANTRLVLEKSHREGIIPREAAMRIAEERVRRAMRVGRSANP